MELHWIVLVPSILVILIAIITKNVIISLLTGIISAALIAKKIVLSDAIELILCRIISETHIKSFYCKNTPSDHLFTFGFLILLGIIISLITHTGGIKAYSKKIESKIKTKKNIESISLILSLFFFLDDYLNTLTVGCIMKPLTDRFKIPRVKLAFLLDSMSAPLCVILPASSWVAFILSQLETSGIQEKINKTTQIIGDTFQVYFHSIPYMLYPIILILSTWFIVRKQISFGIMYQQEKKAEKTNNLYGGKKPLISKISECKVNEGSIWDFIIPIGSFLFSIVFFLLYSGSWTFFGGNKTLFNALLDANPFFALFMSSLISLSISIIYQSLKKNINFYDIKNITLNGIGLMKNSLIVLILAWTLGSILDKDLNTGQYVASLLLNTLPIYTLALTIFITSIAISSSTGSAWGTIAITIPLSIPAVSAFENLSIPITYEQASLLPSVIGALISGAIAGGHISPISDSTVMSSMSSGSYHIDHVSTQVEYIIPVILSSSIGFLLLGIYAKTNQFYIVPVVLLLCIILSFTILYLKNKNQKNN